MKLWNKKAHNHRYFRRDGNHHRKLNTKADAKKRFVELTMNLIATSSTHKCQSTKLISKASKKDAAEISKNHYPMTLSAKSTTTKVDAIEKRRKQKVNHNNSSTTATEEGSNKKNEPNEYHMLSATISENKSMESLSKPQQEEVTTQLVEKQRQKHDEVDKTIVTISASDTEQKNNNSSTIHDSYSYYEQQICMHKQQQNEVEKFYKDKIKSQLYLWDVYKYGLQSVLKLNDLRDAPDAILPGNFCPSNHHNENISFQKSIEEAETQEEEESQDI